ncbi:hypothetical protein PSECIP111854_03441 [Pseudoalteromonas sp. CIP111854]|uniref:Uncharacterized protein n=1 Tax=Pseudoalteromonas holothuriae TaxID=2963714 RepID=A0A9W4R2L3_9GAMM|nr:hypothetical protein [Pseudoalteromonas sp. CIP111854]CAH9064411.1 hypothetical protein PSECIP111854_03441 [Pseudoalteromonas sp. CIP111854]
MNIFREFENIHSVQDVIEILKSHTDYTFSPDKNRLVLKDTASHRLVLYKGPSCFGATLCNSAAHSICLLQGSLRLKKVSLEERLTHNGTSSIIVANGPATITNLVQGDALQVAYLEAFDYHASSDAYWMALYDKEVNHTKSVKLCAVTLEPIITSLLYQNHARLFNFIEILARSTCEKSFQALLALSTSHIDELAWRAIEGIYLRDRYKAAQLVNEYKTAHCCEVIRNRAAAMTSTLDKMEA